LIGQNIADSCPIGNKIDGLPSRKPIKSSEYDEFEDWRRNNLGKSSKRGDFEDWRQKSRIISSKMSNFKDLREIKRYE
jgi:hypothetical protein